MVVQSAPPFALEVPRVNTKGVCVCVCVKTTSVV